MPCRYDLLVIDLDGTLLDPAGVVSAANREAVRLARAAGLQIIVATGRALVESLEPILAIDHQGPVVAAGGAMLNDAVTGRTIRRSVMPVDLVVQITGALIPYGHKVLLLKDPDVTGYHYLAVGPGELDPASRWWFEMLPVTVRFVHSIEEDPHPHETVRAGAVASERELSPIARSLHEKLGDRCFLQHWSAVTATMATDDATHVLEVFNPDVSKWTMVAEYCRQHRIDRGRVAVIGDGLNDVQIVREAGLGVSMGDADPRVLAVADRVTADATSDGVARAIEMILSGRW